MKRDQHAFRAGNSSFAYEILDSLLALLLTLCPSSARAQQFLVASEYAAVAPDSNNGVTLATADFNGDGKMDFVFSEAYPGLGTVWDGAGITIGVALGNGDGTFQDPVEYTVGGLAGPLAVADFNGDGKADIAVVASGVVSILLGNGDGTFQPHRDYAAPPGVFIAVGDLNGDGFPDIVIDHADLSNETDTNVTILLNNGDGTFAAGVDYPAGQVLEQMALGDFNGDGKADIVVANFKSQDSGNVLNSVNVLMNNGDGTFGAPVSYPVPGNGLYVVSVVVGDFNGDGKIDVASWTPDLFYTPALVSVLLGNGDGTFQPHVDYPAGFGFGAYLGTGMTVADLNGDGKPDLAVANAYDNTISVFFGNGDGTFRPHLDYGAGSFPQGIVAARITGGQRDDLLVFNSLGIAVLPSSPARLQSDQLYASGSDPSAIAVGDFNGDGKLDMAVANGNFLAANPYPDQTVSVLLGNGDGTFQSHVDYPTGPYPLSIAAADFNGDGQQDLVTANAASNSLSVLLANPDGTFRPRVDYPTASTPWSVAVGDFDGDGKKDLAVAAAGGIVVSVLLSNGDGTFRPHLDYPTGGSPDTGGPIFIVAADFNGDGKLDLATTDGHLVSVLLGNGDGTFGTYSLVGAGGLSLAVGDFNGDGKRDLAAAAGGLDCTGIIVETCYPGSGVNVLLGNGDGTFQKTVSYPLASHAGPQSVVVGDFNGDGKQDLALANSAVGQSDITAGQSVSILWGNGDGTFGPHIDYVTGSGSFAAAVGDFNGDHKDDLAVANANSNNVAVFLNTGQSLHLLSVNVSAGNGVPGKVLCNPGGMCVGTTA